MKNPALWGALLLATGCGGPSPSASPANGTRPGWVDADRLKNADREPDQWLTGGGGPNEQYYSALDRIDQSNVDRLGLAWE